MGNTTSVNDSLSTNTDPNILKLSIGVLGDSCSGKTALVERFITNIFPYRSHWTFLDNYCKDIVVKDKKVKLTIWDTSGCYALKNINESTLERLKVHGVLLVYDVTCSKNLDEVHMWLKYMSKIKSEAAILLVGNKIDLLDFRDTRAVPLEFVHEFSESHNLEFIECSAKSGENADKVFVRLVEKILYLKGYLQTEIEENQKIEDVNADGKGDITLASFLGSPLNYPITSKNYDTNHNCQESSCSKAKYVGDDTSKPRCCEYLQFESDFSSENEILFDFSIMNRIKR